MKSLILTDERYPAVCIEWNGSATYNIYLAGKNIDVFTHYGRDINTQTTKKEALQIIQDHFDEQENR